MADDDFTLDEKGAISRAFAAGNYGNAYESTDLESFDLDEMSEHERAAFVLGFFGSYSLDEIGSDREIFDESYGSRAGQYVVKVAKYTDDRSDEYREELGDDSNGEIYGEPINPLHVEPIACPACDGPAEILGKLGSRTHARCRSCGIDCSIV